MGFFGGKSQSIAEDAYVGTLEEGSLPMAVAVPASAPSPSPPPPPTNPAFMPSVKVANLDEPVHYKNLPFPRSPTILSICPHCQKCHVRTRIRTAPNWVTWLVAIALFLIFWPICWIPFVADCLKRTDHYCQYCGVLVGSVWPFQNFCVKHRT